MANTLIELAPHLSEYSSDELCDGAEKLYLRAYPSSRLLLSRQPNPCRKCPSEMATCHRYKKRGLPDRTVLLQG